MLTLLPDRKQVKKDKVRTHRLPSIDELAAVSDHNILLTETRVKCVDCLANISLKAPFVRDWLRTSCQRCNSEDRSDIVRTISATGISIGSRTVHSSHKLCACGLQGAAILQCMWL